MKNPGKITRQKILEAGLFLAIDGLHKVTVRAVGRESSVHHTSVVYHFKTLDDLRNAVADAAFDRNDAKIIARLIMDKHPRAAHLTQTARARYLNAAAV